MTIERKTVEGIGDGTIDVAGWRFAVVKDTNDNKNGISLTFKNGTQVLYNQHFNDGDRILIPPAATKIDVDVFSNRSWKLLMQKTVPDANLSELKISLTNDGIYVISGDDDLVHRSQSVDLATVDISGLRVSLDTLGRLFTEALATKTAKDAAQYVKMKNAYLTIFSA
jgi:hypothetical protein